MSSRGTQRENSGSALAWVDGSPCEHGAYYFERDGRQICEDCFGTLNDEELGNHG